MRKIGQMKAGWAGVGILMLFLFCMTGCSSLRSSGPVNSDTGGQNVSGVTPLYYDFKDVLVPGELKPVKKSSYIVQSHGLTAGILAFKGRVDRGALIAFFKENMIRDAWKTIGSFASSRTILLFEKENRWCVININEGDFSTHVEIGVVPMVSENVGGLMK